ncbi:MAG: gephyrin-like molybdotransferase Glp [Desulfonatronovibrionaceae bacterium]
MDDFFNVLKVRDFIQILKRSSLLDMKEVPLEEAGNMFAARDILAGEDLPQFTRSCMDGYAVISRETFGAGESSPAYLENMGEIAVSTVPDFELQPGFCASIVTGAALPPGADSVVMVEHTHDMGGGTIEIRRPVAPGENIMLKGEDMARGAVAVARGERITPVRAGVLAALGVSHVPVFNRPRAGVISSGDELVPVRETPGPGCIRDVNTYTLRQALEKEGAVVNAGGIVPDSENLLKQALEQALEENDTVLISGGSSVGSRDYTIKALEGIQGMEILVHGLALSPGKPTIFARRNQKTVWGLPGQVTSAMVVLHVLVIPFLRHVQGAGDPFDWSQRLLPAAVLTRNVASRYGREDYIRVRVRIKDGQMQAEPLPGKSGLIITLLEADGLVRIEDNCEGLLQGQQVTVLPL